MEPQEQCKPTKYYIDFENVHGAGLKGVDELDERDEVIVIYSQAAETFHIEHAIDILKSKARIEFVEVDGGTRNAADFQLIVALFGAMSDEYEYAIVSGDGGFDAAIKMGERMGLPPVRRIANVRGDEAETDKPKSRRSRRRREDREAEKEASPEETSTKEAPSPDTSGTGPSAPSAPYADEQSSEAQPESASQDGEQKEASSRRRPRRRRRTVSASDDQALAQDNVSDNASRGETGETSANESIARGENEAPSATGEQVDESGAQPVTEQEPEIAPKTRTRRKAKPKSADKSFDQKEISDSTAQSDEIPMPDHLALIREFLEDKGVSVPDGQISTIATSIEGAEGKQDFYRRIIKIERQQRGRELYRLVREHFDALVALVR